MLVYKRPLIKEIFGCNAHRILGLNENQLNRRSEQAEVAAASNVIPDAIRQWMTGKEHQPVD